LWFTGHSHDHLWTTATKFIGWQTTWGDSNRSCQYSVLQNQFGRVEQKRSKVEKHSESSPRARASLNYVLHSRQRVQVDLEMRDSAILIDSKNEIIVNREGETAIL
jgi:hypothetical protein